MFALLFFFILFNKCQQPMKIIFVKKKLGFVDSGLVVGI